MRDLWWRKHRILMSKRHLQGKSPDPNAANRRDFLAALPASLCSETGFGNIANSDFGWGKVDV